MIEAEGRAHRRPARASRQVPLRPRRDDDVPRRRGAGPRRRPPCRSWRCWSDRATSRLVPRDRGSPTGDRGSASCARTSAAPRTSSRRSSSPVRRASRSCRR
jgi:hypothetical protein